MKIVKSESFRKHEALTTFINEYKIEREDIITIVVTARTASSSNCVIFFYGDPNVVQKREGAFWD